MPLAPPICPDGIMPGPIMLEPIMPGGVIPGPESLSEAGFFLDLGSGFVDRVGRESSCPPDGDGFSIRSVIPAF